MAVRSGRKAVATAGIPVTLLATTVDHAVRMAGWVTVCADLDNTGVVYVGGTEVQNASGAGGYIGHPLAKGEFVNLREMGGPAYIDMATIFVDADTSADEVTFNYGQR
jgi:hypothetical protein